MGQYERHFYMIVLVGAEKGGTGKTVLCVQLAALRALQGKNVIIVDTDKQATALRWKVARDKNEDLPQKINCLRLDGQSIGEKIKSLPDRYDDVFIDTRGSDAVELRASMVVADYFLTPVRSAQFDMWTIEQVETIFWRAKAFNEQLRAGIVINLAKANSRDTAIAIKDMEKLNHLKFSGVVIVDRDIYHRSQPGGGSVFEYKVRDKKAEQEVAKIHQVIYERPEEDIEALISSVRKNAGRTE